MNLTPTFLEPEIAPRALTLNDLFESLPTDAPDSGWRPMNTNEKKRYKEKFSRDSLEDLERKRDDLIESISKGGGQAGLDRQEWRLRVVLNAISYRSGSFEK